MNEPLYHMPDNQVDYCRTRFTHVVQQNLDLYCAAIERGEGSVWHLQDAQGNSGAIICSIIDGHIFAVYEVMNDGMNHEETREIYEEIAKINNCDTIRVTANRKGSVEIYTKDKRYKLVYAEIEAKIG